MKRTICISLACMLVLIAMPMMSFASSASTYEELWTQKEEYEKDWHGVGVQDGHSDVYYEIPWRILPYTEVGKNLTYVWDEYQEGGDYLPWEMFHYGEIGTLYSPELKTIYYESLKEPDKSYYPGVCHTHRMIQALGMTEEDFRGAFEKMKTDPQSARQTLSFLSDEEFKWYLFMIDNLVSYELQLCQMPDFVIEALFWEDETQAQYLLSKKGAVYVPELGYSLLIDDDFYFMNIEEIAKNDLTTDGFSYFLGYLREYVENWEKQEFGKFVFPDGRTAKEKLEYLESAREAQLAAAKTGDGTVGALWVIALALPALTVVAVKRKRRI